MYFVGVCACMYFHVCVSVFLCLLVIVYVCVSMCVDKSVWCRGGEEVDGSNSTSVFVCLCA